MKIRNIFFFAILGLSLLHPAFGQNGEGVKTPTAEELKKSKNDLVEATKEYKESLEKLLDFYSGDVKKAAEAAEKRRKLFEQGIVARRDVETAERAIIEAEAKLDGLKKQIVEADAMIAEAEAIDQILKAPPVAKNSYRATNVLIRYTGSYAWNIQEIVRVQKFFTDRFGRQLPISAFGQSKTHDQLGFDHRNCVDVALHPDSEEGEALMEFLRNAGIPFLAFRQAVPGASTNPHIHIGRPSPRLSTPSM